MRVFAVRPVFVLLALVALWQLSSPRVLADETPATPVAEATPTNRSNLPPEICSAAEIAAGDTQLVEQPLMGSGANVQPADTPGRDLYLVILTLPPGSCVGYGSHYLHDGAIVWFVQEGEIEFATHPIGGLPPATVTAFDENLNPITISGTSVLLGPGDWVTLDRAADYTYRNAGTEPAVVLMTVNEVDPFLGFARSCKGGCRKR
jgi:hypothetical protein